MDAQINQEPNRALSDGNGQVDDLGGLDELVAIFEGDFFFENRNRTVVLPVASLLAVSPSAAVYRCVCFGMRLVVTFNEANLRPEISHGPGIVRSLTSVTGRLFGGLRNVI